MNEQNHNKRKLIISVVSLISLMLLIIGTTYALFKFNQKGNQINKISTGTIFVEFTEDTDRVSLTNLIPMTDEEEKKRDDTSNRYHNLVLTYLSIYKMYLAYTYIIKILCP